MAKKYNNNDGDDFEDNLDINYTSGLFIKDEIDLSDIDDDLTFLDIDEIESEQEIYDEDDEDCDDDYEEKEYENKKNKYKPKLIGKHSLKYDSIFKGSIINNNEDKEYDSEHFIKNGGGSMDISDGITMEETKNNIDYYREVKLKEDVYNALLCHTDINFDSIRRKPSKQNFNDYYGILLKHLQMNGYTRTELFIELYQYFSEKT
jgi:hypothetical protein